NHRKVSGLFAALSLLAFSSCNSRSGLPAPGSPAYREFCSAFYLGLAALQSGEDVNARKGLQRATEIAPGEPAGWVNLALLDARQQEFDAALRNLQQAIAIAPQNSAIEGLLGLVESRRGNIAQAKEHYRKAVSADAANLRALYAWAAETERERTSSSDTEALALLDRIRRFRPDSEPLLLDIIRLSAKQNDVSRLPQAIAALGKGKAAWPEVSQDRYAGLRKAAEAGDARAAAIEAQFLRNTLLRTLPYRRSLEQLKTPDTAVGEPITKLMRLPAASAEPAPPDTALRFTAQSFQPAALAGLAWIGAIPLGDGGEIAMAWANAEALYVEGAGPLPLPRPGSATLADHSILAADLNYDFKTDIVIAVSSGLRIFRQTAERRFQDVTTQARLPLEIQNGAYWGAWTLDFDLDGDLDIVLGPAQGAPTVLRNNGDGTFTPISPFPGVNGLKAFTNADIDGDGTPDVAVIDNGGRLFVFRNERLGAYSLLDVPPALASGNVAVAAGDLNIDGAMDFILLRQDSRIVRLSNRESGGWDAQDVARVEGVSSSLLLADLDNNGALDIIAGNQVFLGDGQQFPDLPAALPVAVSAAVDRNADGRLDLFGLDGAKKVVQLTNTGAKNYRWQVIRTRAASVMGDQRINPFGIGGEIEIRSGLFTQKQLIDAPLLHFGLGEHSGVEFARIVWPNGLIQAEFELKADQSVLAQQRLKGSCPFLFSWDGQGLRFLKDVGPMSAAIGAHADGAALESIQQTEQWFHIQGNQLAPRDGYYDLRLTNEYWETYYVDRYSLLTVDHPEGSHVHVDERVAHHPAPLRVYVTGAPQPFASAKDDTGRDVSDTINRHDARYLNAVGVGQYQGLTRDHWVELELPAEAPRQGPLYLLGSGFIRPWDETITMARSQGNAPSPQALHIEVQDANGRWIAASDDLGIPAGRLKSIVLEIGQRFRPGAPRRLRLRTNLEIYWDSLSWAPGIPGTEVKTMPSALAQAELRYRGYSRLTQASPLSPELPEYGTIVRTTPQWRDLEGYYTRYGEVRELLDSSDDRVVLMNSADELRLRFAAQPSPAAGWKRDYVFITDGWIKEGDYNFRLSKSVLPLPHRGMESYSAPLLPLENDPVYRKHASDWQRYHTRYVTPRRFTRALWSHAEN
ncbi:MAG TPA: FG-GAP-like repeat-containing protein, partial [Bryobacteraceae bacterium]|nr:FG-GAP-like repeat-containing protein [Bryobacteraceae bacterium]